MMMKRKEFIIIIVILFINTIIIKVESQGTQNFNKIVVSYIGIKTCKKKNNNNHVIFNYLGIRRQ